VVLTLWVLVEQRVPRIVRGRRTAVVYILPGARVGEGKVVGREADYRAVVFVELVYVEGGKAAEDVAAIG
jgi:hypothetical protein